MALTGVALILFLIAHLLGNLQVFLGQDTFNSYAALLKSMPGLLWGARVGLLAVFLMHVATAFKLRQVNRAARENDYQSKATVQASAASLYMLETGIVVLIFVIIHLLHFTIGVLKPEAYSLLDATGRHDVYSMLVMGFQDLRYSGTYIICVAFLGLHLSHAFSSLVQTLGFNHPRYTPCIEKAGVVLATLIALGYISIPASVIAGIIQLPNGVM